LAIVMQVPDSRAVLRVLGDGSGIDRSGVKFVCNPFDEFAVEQAVQIREGAWDVSDITVLTAGGSEAASALRTALAMGADQGLHLRGEALPLHDEVAMARLIAAAIRQQETQPDLVLCGKKTIDNDSGELGPALAEFLGLPHVGAVTGLELDDTAGRARIHRGTKDGEVVLEGDLPMLLTCDKGLVEPRYPSLPMIMKAKKKPIDTIDAATLGCESLATTEFVHLQAPPERPPCRVLDGSPEEMARELVDLLRTEAKVI
jgi:electron transfer flavoprotein beta subunit